MSQNSKFEISKRRQQVAEYRLQGMANFEIAELVHVSPSQISRDLKCISKEWAKERIEDINQIKEKELHKLDLIEKRAWKSWERSCDVKTKKSMKKKGTAFKEETGKTKIVGNDSEQTFTEEQQIGDPRYMTIILDCIAKRSKILGYEAAQKVDLTSKGEKIKSGAIIFMPSNGREVVETVPESSENVSDNG
jgi:hypothetical protein